MKPTKLLTALVLLFITTSIFAQKVHYKDRYYTIVKSKIFHRGYDVYGRLSPGKIDTIYIIAKELYTENGKLKEKYKKRKKRDRYKLPEGFWKQKEAVAAVALNATSDKNTSVVLTPPSVAVKTDDEEVIQEEKPSQELLVANEKEKNNGEKEVQIKDKIREPKDEMKENSTERKKEEKQQKEQSAKDEKKQRAKTDDDRRLKAQMAKEKKKENSKKRKAEKVLQEKAQEKRVKSSPTKETEIRKSKQVKDPKNQVEKSRTRETNQAKKTTKNRAQETKKLENKKRDSDKTKNTKSKKQHATKGTAAVIATASLANASLSNEETFGTIYLKVNTEKTSTTKSGDLLLFFDVINNSNKDLIILKPNNSTDIRVDFFLNTMECEDVPIKSTDYIAKNLKIKDEDFITIPANTKIELFVNSTYRNSLACNSEDIVLQIRYNPFKNTEEGIELEPRYKKELNKALKRITPIKIESENVKFKLNKQE